LILHTEVVVVMVRMKRSRWDGFDDETRRKKKKKKKVAKTRWKGRERQRM
jgi:hypothetical protein